MMNNGRPLGTRKTIRIMLALTILAWATQTLFHQWGRGAEIQLSDDAELAGDKFVPGTSRFSAGATLELRAEATITGQEVKLKQVCRWADSDAAAFEPIADMVLFRLDAKRPFRSINVEDIKSTLNDAGVNMAVIKFAGATACTVNRGDVQYDEHAALQQWIEARDEAKAPATQPAAVVVDASPGKAAPDPAAKPQAAPEEKTYCSLRDLLLTDLSQRLSLPPESLEVHFNPQDEKVLKLAEPHFQFQLQPRRVRNLGDVSWDVTIIADKSTQKASITATARAWQQQLVVMKPLAFKQLIRDEDVIERRALVDHLTDETLLAKSQAVGQQAASELKPGMILTGRNVDAVALVKAGQLVTVTLSQGAVQVKSVARAMESGTFGQTIRVKNESTKDVMEVVLTGPQSARLGGAGVASVAE